MGETKKIDAAELSAICRKWLPVFHAADRLRNIEIVDVLDSEEFVSLAYIQGASQFTISGTHRIISLAVRAGLIEKNPAGGRGPLYRGTERLRAVLAATVKTDALTFFAKSGRIFSALSAGPNNQSGLCENIGAQQTTISLKMKRLIAAGWIEQEQKGKEVWYSLSDYARRVIPVVAAELKGLK